MSPSVGGILFYVFFCPPSFSVFLMLSCACSFPILTLMPSLPERRGDRASWKPIRRDSFLHIGGERLRNEAEWQCWTVQGAGCEQGKEGRPQKLHSVDSLEAWLLAFLPSS